MKKYLVLAAIVCMAVLLFSNCHTQKKSMSTTPSTAAVTYAGNLQAIIQTRCSPCHVPSKGGNKKALDTYDGLKGSIVDAVSRIQLNPGDRGFMPFRSAKLGADTIAMFVQWRDGGTPQ
ncbi:MAG TPA: hypothetical protein VGI82_05625 [Chitinophagaceae bacterium]